VEICRYFNGIIDEVYGKKGKDEAYSHEISFFRVKPENQFNKELRLQDLYDNWSGLGNEQRLKISSSSS
jgi:hypothetical protein